MSANNVIGENIHLGSSDFAEIILQNALYVDKSLLIQELLDDHSKTILITRPRRWGKTLSMSMLQHFFAQQVIGLETTGLFDDLLIAQVDDGKYMQHQGRYPVIYLSFKDVKSDSFAGLIENLSQLINRVYMEHQYLNASTILTAVDKKLYQKYLDTPLNEVSIENALQCMSMLLSKHYNSKVYILIDEYDTPLNSTYSADYFAQLIRLMKNMLSNALKDNPYLEKGIMTGILRISKDSMLSGLNNLQVYTVLDKKYNQHFGFTNLELDLLFAKRGLEQDEELVKSWYNGYLVGGVTIYNPWSILSCLKNDGVIKAYWVNTADDSLLKVTLQHASNEIKDKLQRLLVGNSIESVISESVRFDSLATDEEGIWSLLLYAGYLTASTFTSVGETCSLTMCALSVPNKEIRSLYRGIFINWLGVTDNNWRTVVTLLEDLLLGQVEQFTNKISKLLLTVASIRDYANQPEAFYHGFMLALTCTLLDDYYIFSNKESGLGYPDLLFIAKDQGQTKAVILEFKHVGKNEDAQLVAQSALEQINAKSYAASINQYGYVASVLKVGLAFDGKIVQCAYDTVRTT